MFLNSLLLLFSLSLSGIVSQGSIVGYVLSYNYSWLCFVLIVMHTVQLRLHNVWLHTFVLIVILII